MNKPALAVIALLFPVASFATVKSSVTCWTALRELSPSISSDLKCVKEMALTPLLALCAADGVGKTKGFSAYLILKERYEKAVEEGKDWMIENPEASQLSPRVAANIRKARTAWLIAGKKNKIENDIEMVVRKSASCD